MEIEKVFRALFHQSHLFGSFAQNFHVKIHIEKEELKSSTTLRSEVSVSTWKMKAFTFIQLNTLLALRVYDVQVKREWDD